MSNAGGDFDSLKIPGANYNTATLERGQKLWDGPRCLPLNKAIGTGGSKGWAFSKIDSAY